MQNFLLAHRRAFYNFSTTYISVVYIFKKCWPEKHVFSRETKMQVLDNKALAFLSISKLWKLFTFESALRGGQYWAKCADYQLITKGLVNILNAFFAHSAHSASWHWFLTRIVFSYVITSIISLSSFLGVKLYLDNIISCLYSLWTTSLIANR